MKKIYRRILALGLSVSLMVTSLPTMAFAEEAAGNEDAAELLTEEDSQKTQTDETSTAEHTVDDALSIEGIEGIEAPDENSEGENTAKLQTEPEEVVYEKKTAAVSGSFCLVAEHSTDKRTTDGLAVTPVTVAYEPGDTILSAINRLDGMECTEQFGENVEDGSIFLNGEAYVATADTHNGLITLSDMLAPEEVTVVRLHQNRDGEAPLDYFPAELQTLIKAMASVTQDQTEDVSIVEAYRTAEENYASAVQDPAQAEVLAGALRTGVQEAAGTAKDEEAVSAGEDHEMAAAVETEPEDETEAAGESEQLEDPEAQTSSGSGAKAIAVQEGQSTFAVVFHVTYNGEEISDATITLKSSAGQELTGTDKYSFALHRGWYDYIIEKKDYEVIQGRFQVEAQDQTIEAELIPSRDQKYAGVLTFTCKDQPVEDVIVTLKNAQTGGTSVYLSDENGQVSYELNRGPYTWSAYKKQRYGYTVAHENTYRQIYEASTGNFEVTKDAEKNQTFVVLTKVRYPHITDVLFGNESRRSSTMGFVSYKDVTPAYNDGGAPFVDGVTYTLTIPDYKLERFFIEFRWDNAMEAEDRSITVKYQNQSTNEMAVIENFPVKLYTLYELFDFVSIAKGGGRLTVETEADGETEVFYIDVKIPRTLRSLKVSEDGNTVPLVPEFSPTVKEYTVNVAADAEVLSLTPRMFQAERAGYQLTVNGEAAASNETVQIALSKEKEQTIPVMVSHTDGQQTTYQIHVRRIETETHRVTFSLLSGEEQVSDAVLVVKNAAGTTMEPEEGYRYRLPAGVYTYHIQRGGEKDETGTFGVGSQDREIPVYLSQANAETHLLKELGYISAWDTCDLELKPGVFEYWIYECTWTVPSIVATFSEQAQKEDKKSIVMEVGGKEQELVSGIRQSVNVTFDDSDLESTKVILRVTAGSKSQTYVLHMLQSPSIGSLQITENGKLCMLTPKFSYTESDYEMTVKDSVSSVYVQMTPFNRCTCTDDMTICINGTELAYGVMGRTVQLSAEQEQEIRVTLICNRTGAEKTYTIKVKKEAGKDTPMLERLYLGRNATGNGGEEYIAFQPDVYAYQAEIPNTGYRTERMYLTAELDDAYTDGKLQLSYTYSDGSGNAYETNRISGTEIPLFIGEKQLESLTVTAVASDGTRQEYVIQIRLRTYLKSLQVLDENGESLTLSPQYFHFRQTEYVVYVSDTTREVTVLAAAGSNSAQMELDGMAFLGTAKLPADGKKHTLAVWQEDGDAVTEYTLQTQLVRNVILTAQYDGKELPDGLEEARIAFYDEDGNAMQESSRKSAALDVNGSYVFELPDGSYTWEIELYGFRPASGAYTVNGRDDEIVVNLEKYKAGKRTVTFQIQKNGEEVKNAEIYLKKWNLDYETGQINWNTWMLPDGGGYQYTIYAAGCAVYTGEFSVNGEDQQIPVELSPSPGDKKGESRTVYLTLAQDGACVNDSDGNAIFRREITVDYFDLSRYLLQDYFCYTDQDETIVSSNPTWLHLLVAAEEQLRGGTVKKGTEALTLTKDGKLAAYWGWSSYFLLSYGDDYECPIGTKVMTEELEDGEEIRIDLVKWNPQTLENGLYVTVPFAENGARETTVQQGLLQSFHLQARYAYGWQNKLYNLNNAYVEMRSEGSSEWKTVDAKSDENGQLSVWFGDPGTWYVRVAEPYPSGTFLADADQVIRYESVIHVEPCPQQAVRTTFSVTMKGIDVTREAEITVSDAAGNTMEDIGTSGWYQLVPGRYTYAIAASDAEGTFTKQGSFYVLSDEKPVSVTEELRDPLYLREISIALEQGGTKQWKTILSENSEIAGKYDYIAGLKDSGNYLRFYIRAFLKQELANEAKIWLEYVDANGDTHFLNVTGMRADGLWISSLFPYQFSLNEKKELLLHVTCGEEEQTYHIGIYRIPTLRTLTARAGDILLESELDSEAQTCQLTVGQNTEAISLHALASQSEAELLLNGEVMEDGSAELPLEKEGDTTASITVRWKEPVAFGGTAEQTYTLTVHKEAEEDQGAHGVLEDLSLYRSGSSGADRKYKLTPEFSADVYDYTITMKDSESTVDIYTAVAKEAQETATVTIRALNSQNGELQSTEADNTGATENRIRNVRTAYGADGQVINVIVADGAWQRTYVIHVLADRKLEYLRIKEKGMNRSMTLTPVFDRMTYEYEAVAQSYTTAVEVRAGCIGKSFLLNGYHLSINGTEIEEYDQSVEVPLSGRKTPVQVRLWYGEEEPLIYTVTVIRNIAAEVTFRLKPSGGNLQLADSTGELLYPEGSRTDGEQRIIGYTLSAEETYRWTASCAGCIGQSGEFEAADGDSYEITLQAAEKNPDIQTDMDAEWGDFRGEDNNAVTDAPTPKQAEDAMLYWAVKSGDGWDGTAASPPILVNGYLYFYAGNRLIQMDKTTGTVLRTAQMVGRSSFSINPPTFGDGMIFVALSGGVIQAFNASTMESLWVFHDTFGTEFGSNQPNCPIIYRNGYLYTGFWNNDEKPGHFVCLSATDEDPHNQTEEKYPMWVRSQAGGFYWAGAYAGDKYILVGTDDGQFGSTSQTGNLLSMDPVSGVLLDTLEGLNGDIRSTVMYDETTQAFYFTSKGGSFYQVKVREDGTFQKDSLRELSLAVDGKGAMSTSTPVICNGRAYVGYSGGGQFTAYDHHGIAVIDLAQFAIAYRANTKGYPQTSGLLAKQGDTAYVYFVDNYTPGMIRVIKDQPGQTELADPATETWTRDGRTQTIRDCAPVLFTPGSDHAEYAISSLIADSDGTLYFKNDSNYIFALGSAIDHLEVVQQPEKQTYIKGESFDVSGLKVEAVYKNGLRRDVTSRITVPEGALSEKDVSVRIRYTYGLYNDTNTAKTVYTDISIRVVKDAGALRVLETIQAIRTIGDVTLEKEAQIRAAREAYEAVPEEQKNEVVNYFLLERAEQTLTKLKGDHAALEELKQKIQAIGEVTLEKEAQIAEARYLYNSFADELRAQVEEALYQRLTNAEKELERLKAKKDAEDKNGDDITSDETGNGGTGTGKLPSPPITDNKTPGGSSNTGNAGKRPATSSGNSGTRPSAGGNRVQASGSITGGGVRRTSTGSGSAVQKKEGVISRESGSVRTALESENESEIQSESDMQTMDETETERKAETEAVKARENSARQLASAGITGQKSVSGLSASVLYVILGTVVGSLLLLLLAAVLLKKKSGKKEQEDEEEWDD